MLKNILLTISLFLFGYICYNSLDLYHQIRNQKELKEDHAAINMITYGLFDIQLWKRQALEIFKKNIEEYEIEPSAYEELDRTLQVYLKQLYKQYFESGELIDTILDRLIENGSLNKMFVTIIQKNIGSQLSNLNLENEIPGLSQSLISEIKKNEPQIKSYFQSELLGMVMTDVQEQLSDRRVPYYKKYGFDSYHETNAYLNEKISSIELQEKPSLIFNIGLISILLILLIIEIKWIGFRMMILGLTLVSVIFLVLGITFPMIDIDARLNAFTISLMGEPISFDEQIIYFQSKSILDVTQTLWQGHGWDLKLVGTLVFCFSIVFPLTKLILSAFYLFSEKVATNKWVQQIIFHLGKWSMADVFVVAMFMAYIGFYGIITSQLSSISNNPNGYAVETLNYSRLAPGAMYFTAYCILSVVIGVLINKKPSGILNSTKS
jgi:hypothetical protein